MAAIPKTISKKILNDMAAAAIRNYPREACGVLVETHKGKYAFVECKNDAPDPTPIQGDEKFFIMNAQDLVKAYEVGEVVAVWHSHIDRDTTPSDADKAGCQSSEVPWFITSITKNAETDKFVISEPHVFTAEGFEMPYLGRVYVFGVFDCWMLCRDYLLREFGVKLDPLPELHVPNWWDEDVDILGDNYEAQGLVRLEPGTPAEKGDIFFMQFCGFHPNHCAIYIGDDMILHHQQDRLSSRAVYGGQYQKHTTHHLRHKSLMK